MRDALRVSMHRTRRMSLLGEVPLLGHLVVPWLWPLHLVIVGATAGHIRHTPDASLSFCDGTRPRRLPRCWALAAAVTLGWLAMSSAAIVALSVEGPAAAGWALLAVLTAVPIVELLALVEFAVLNPAWLTIKRERRRRAHDRTTIVLTTLVSRVDGHDFAGQLMGLEFPHWHALGARVIGYPGTRSLVSYYVRMGARRDRPGPGGGRAGRRVIFDCRRQLRVHPRPGAPRAINQLRTAAAIEASPLRGS